MINTFFKNSKKYIILLTVLLVMLLVSFNLLNNYIIEIDNSCSTFINNYIVKDKLTQIFKIITNLGGLIFFILSLLTILLAFKNKKIFYLLTINLTFTYIISVIFKNIFRRERPLTTIIDKPIDFSFPSGHTMCSIAFYGFLIYVFNKKLSNKYLKYIINAFLIIICLLIAFSRIYLGVHFLSDVIFGAVLGIICLLIFINYDKMNNIL